MANEERALERDMKTSGFSGIGVVTLFVVLLILALTVFAVLTFASTRADLRLSRKNAETVLAYYDADRVAVLIGADAAALWPQDAPRPGDDALERFSRAVSAREDAEIVYVEYAADGAGLDISYGVALDALLTLNVALHLPEAGVCRVVSWQLSTPKPAVSDAPPDLWRG